MGTIHKVIRTILVLSCLVTSAAFGANPAFSDFTKSWRLHTNLVTADTFATVVAAAVPGDVIEVPVGPITISNKVTVPRGVTIIGQGDATDFQCWIPNTVHLVLSDNCRVERIRMSQMLPLVGGAPIGFNGGANDAAPTNSIARYITATNWYIDCGYCVSTNYYQVLFQDCNFQSRWDALIISPFSQNGPSDPLLGTNTSQFVAQRCRFAVINQSGLNGQGDAHAAWATGGGSNFFENCTFEISGTPTNAMTQTNNYALAFQSFNGGGTLTATGCRMVASGVNPHSVANIPRSIGTQPYNANTIYQGVTNAFGAMIVAGCTFDSTSATGPVQVLSLPVTNGLVMVDDTNFLYVLGSGQSDVNFLYTNSLGGNLPIAGVPGYASTDGSGAELWRSTNVWKLVEPFGTVYYTNNATQPTNLTGSGWQVFAGNGASTPVPLVRWGRYSTNSITIPGNINFTTAPLNTALIINTNFVYGLIYTNGYNAPIEVVANAILTSASVGGDSTVSLWVYGSATNVVSAQTVVGTTVTTNEIPIMGFVPAGSGYTFTNSPTTGTGDSSTIRGGQILRH